MSAANSIEKIKRLYNQSGARKDDLSDERAELIYEKIVEGIKKFKTDQDRKNQKDSQSPPSL